AGEVFVDGLAEGAGALAVEDLDAVEVGLEGVVDEAGDLREGFVDALAAQVDAAAGRQGGEVGTGGGELTDGDLPPARTADLAQPAEPDAPLPRVERDEGVVAADLDSLGRRRAAVEHHLVAHLDGAGRRARALLAGRRGRARRRGGAAGLPLFCFSPPLGQA